jgi:hypothetical protein
MPSVGLLAGKIRGENRRKAGWRGPTMDDPEELAAAFFAEQAAKEKARITLPVDDWTQAIIAVAGEEVTKENIDSSSYQTSLSTTTAPTTATAWLVTTMPPAPTYRLANNVDDKVGGDRCGSNEGIVGIILNSNETRLLRTTSEPKFRDATSKAQK